MDQIMEEFHKLSLLSRSEQSDTLIIIDGQRLKVHKSVLMSSSEYFRALFESEMIETMNKEIILKETLIKPFLIVLKMSYNIETTAEEWLVLKLQEICESIITANKYQFIESERHLSEKLIDIFEYKLSESRDQLTNTTTVWEVLEMAKLHNLMILYDLCLIFFDENIDYAFNTFDKQFVCADILLDVLRRDTFAPLEYKIFKIAKKWFKKQKIVSIEESTQNMVLDSVRFSLLSLSDLNTINNNGLYEPEMYETKVKLELNPEFVPNKRIYCGVGTVLESIYCKNKMHVNDDQNEISSYDFVLQMPSKINHLIFEINSHNSIQSYLSKYYANYWIGIEDSQAEEGFTKIFLKNYCNLGEQHLYSDQPFVTEKIRIVMECYRLSDEQTPEDLLQREPVFSRPDWHRLLEEKTFGKYKAFIKSVEHKYEKKTKTGSLFL